jgi:hypothetical protein
MQVTQFLFLSASIVLLVRSVQRKRKFKKFRILKGLSDEVERQVNSLIDDGWEILDCNGNFNAKQGGYISQIFLLKRN